MVYDSIEEQYKSQRRPDNPGFDVVGVFMKNWDEKDEFGNCSADKEAEVAEWVCQKLEIPFRHVNFVKEYWTDVFSYLLNEYQNGCTPNPDVFCNKHIKFHSFLDYAINIEGADAIATGHYARTSFGDLLENYNSQTGVKLLQAVDRHKDQTFFLSQVPQKSLQRTLFPIGSLKKEMVREIARKNSLHQVAAKRDSTGICFIGKRNFANFISEYVSDKRGPFIDIDTNEKVGEHRGLHYWTLGQRAKLQGYPWQYFTCEKDVDKNIIYVARGWDHPYLFTDALHVEPLYWIHSPPDEYLKKTGQLECQFRFQHGQPLVNCVVAQLDRIPECKSSLTNGDIIKLSQLHRALTPGQFAVIYKGEECLGSAKILSPLRSLNQSTYGGIC